MEAPISVGGHNKKYFTHKDLLAAYRARGRKYYEQRRLDALAVMGSKCVRCGFDDPRALQFDHINGDGHTIRKHGQTNSVMVYLDILQKGHPERYQLLCANCNWIKKHENGENPPRTLAA